MQLLFTLFFTLVIRHQPSYDFSKQTNFSAYVITHRFVFRYPQYPGQYEGTNMARVSSVSSTHLQSFHILYDHGT
jgi:hypothetical protein